MKKVTYLAVACATAFSLGAVAAGDKEQKQQPQAQSGQSPSAAGGQSASGGASAPGGQSSQKQASQSSETIKQVQEKLSAAGHDVQVDGIMGPKTQAALKEYQESKGLQASGQLDQKTIAALGVSEGASASTGSSAAGGTSSGSEQPKAQEESKEKSSK